MVNNAETKFVNSQLIHLQSDTQKYQFNVKVHRMRLRLSLSLTDCAR
jgi:hypothetical protein